MPTDVLQLIWLIMLAVGGWLSRDVWDWYKKRDQRTHEHQQEKLSATDERHREFYQMIREITDKSNEAVTIHNDRLGDLASAIKRMMDHEEKMLDALASMASRDEGTNRVLISMQVGQQELQRSMNLLLAKLVGEKVSNSGVGEEAYQEVLRRMIEESTLSAPTIPIETQQDQE